MNLQKTKEIIEFYKKHFHAISKEEIYKWRAVKHFQNNWDIAAKDYTLMLENSLRFSGNLLDSGNYFPKRMLLLNTRIEPETIRKLFNELYDEEKDWVKRIMDFQNGIAILTKKYFPSHKKHYQDARAVLVYLTLRFPDIYFFYKYSMFKEFIEKVDYPYKAKKGRVENLTVYFNLCELLKEEIVKDIELLELHTQCLAENDYIDNSSNILTQDVIYATVEHFKRFKIPIKQEPVLKRLVKVSKQITSKPEQTTLKGAFVNYVENEKTRKRIGDFGELLVLKFEQEKLRELGSNRRPEHVAKTKGDGEGYDILSFNESDEELFIEVKTTTGNFDAPFFITKNELEKSIIEKERFYLYRLFNFNEKDDSAKFLVIQGSLETLCINPVLYRVRAEEGPNESSSVMDIVAEKL
jgi:hypothetical protein